MFDLLEIIRVRIELPDVRELIRNQDRIDKPALLIVDGVGIGRAIVQELGREMRHLLPGSSFDGVARDFNGTIVTGILAKLWRLCFPGRDVRSKRWRTDERMAARPAR